MIKLLLLAMLFFSTIQGKAQDKRHFPNEKIRIALDLGYGKYSTDAFDEFDIDFQGLIYGLRLSLAFSKRQRIEFYYRINQSSADFTHDSIKSEFNHESTSLGVNFYPLLFRWLDIFVGVGSYKGENYIENSDRFTPTQRAAITSLYNLTNESESYLIYNFGAQVVLMRSNNFEITLTGQRVAGFKSEHVQYEGLLSIQFVMFDKGSFFNATRTNDDRQGSDVDRDLYRPFVE